MVERIVVGLLSTNAYIFSQWKKECILIDPGGDEKELISHMTSKNLKPRGIICTHGHLDHLSSAGKIQQYYRERGNHLPIAIHEADRHYLGADALKVHKASFANVGMDNDILLSGLYSFIPEPEIIFKDGDMLFDSGLSVIHTPGHTPGSVCLYSEEQSLLFSGDTLFFEGIGRTDLPGGDGKALIRNIREKLMILPEETRVCPGHGPYSTIEREKKHNPFL